MWPTTIFLALMTGSAASEGLAPAPAPATALATAPATAEVGTAQNPGIVVSCRRDHYISPSGTCVSCPEGRYQDHGNGATECKVAHKPLQHRLPCRLGFYRPVALSACKPCPRDGPESGRQAGPNVPRGCGRGLQNLAATFRQVPSESGRSLKDCKHGEVMTSSGSCSDCPPGFYDKTTSSSVSSCIPCAVGTFNSWHKQKECWGCRKGKYTAQTGMAECTDCPAGRYHDRDWNVKTACDLCPVGRYTAQTGLQSENDCTRCEAGKYQGQRGEAACISCPRGKYEDATGQWICRLKNPPSCASGGQGYSSGSPSSPWASCAPCGTGQYAPTMTTEACKPWSVTSCALGAGYQAGSNMADASCTPCVFGVSYSDESNEGPCKPHSPTSCSRGEEFSGGLTNAPGSSCTTCSPGKYNDRAGRRDCRDWETNSCPQGEGFAAGSVTGDASCSPCVADETHSNANNQEACKPNQFTSCPVGQGYMGGSVVEDNSACIQCATGRYNDGADRSGCIACGIGFFQNGNGKSKCKNCQRGRFNDQTVRSQCTDCNPGAYGPDIKRTEECIRCEAGRFQAQKRGSECSLCDAGRYLSETGSESDESCIACLAGKYSLDGPGQSNAATCKPCGAGKYSSAGVAHISEAVCISCDPGKHSASVGQTEVAACKDCDAGQYGDLEPPIACTPCDAGLFQDETGRGACDICGTGFYQDQNGQAKCKNCFRGRFNDQTGRDSNCEECASGMYGPNPKATTCPACEPGKYQNSRRKSECKLCVSGKYSSSGGGQTAEAVCLACAAGKYSSSGGGQTAEAVCLACAAGKYSSSGGGQTAEAVCLACAAGKYSSAGGGQTAEAVCLACAAGKYSSSGGGQTAEAVCIACAAGKYSSSGSGQTAEAVCIRCEQGEFQDQTSQVSCLNCLPGRRSASVATPATSCPVCAAGKYQPGARKSECTACGAGQTSDEGASKVRETSCSPCPNKKCAAGKFYKTGSPCSPASDCQACVPGYYCPGESPFGRQVVPVPGSFFSNTAGAESLAGAEAERCPEGYYCEPGTTSSSKAANLRDGTLLPKSVDLLAHRDEGPWPFWGSFGDTREPRNPLKVLEPEPCPAGADCRASTGLPRVNVTTLPKCPAGYFCLNKTGASGTEPVPCTKGHFCGEGSEGESPCLPGQLCNDTKLVEPYPCPPGAFCEGRETVEAVGCPMGYCCGEETVMPQTCSACAGDAANLTPPAGPGQWYCAGNTSVPVAAGSGECGVTNYDAATRSTHVVARARWGGAVEDTFSAAVGCGFVAINREGTFNNVSDIHLKTGGGSAPRQGEDTSTTRTFQNMTLVNKSPVMAVAWNCTTAPPARGTYRPRWGKDAWGRFVGETGWMDGNHGVLAPGSSIHQRVTIWTRNHASWGKYGGSVNGTMPCTWWLVHPSAAANALDTRRVSKKYRFEIAVMISVTARVPAITWPQKIERTMNVDDAASEQTLDVYAVGDGQVSYSVETLPDECAAEQSYRDPLAAQVGAGTSAASIDDGEATTTAGSKLDWLTTNVPSAIVKPKTGVSGKIAVSLDPVINTDPLRAGDNMHVRKACVVVSARETNGTGLAEAADEFVMKVPVTLRLRTRCHPGTWSAVGGLSPCKPCPTDTYQAMPGQTSCVPCSSREDIEDVVKRQAASTWAVAGMWSAKACFACPEGGKCRVCRGGTRRHGSPPPLPPPPSGTNATGRPATREAMRGGEQGDSQRGQTQQRGALAPGTPPPQHLELSVVAKSGYYRAEGCSGKVHNGTVNAVFVPCPRALSCLGARTRTGKVSYLTDGYLVGNLVSNVSARRRAAGDDAGDDAELDAASNLVCEEYLPAPRNLFLNGSDHESMLEEVDFAEGCAPGYEGALCLACAASFSKWGPTRCQPCGSQSTILLGSILVILVAILGTLWLVRWAIRDKGNVRNIGVDLIKILYNHIQLLSIMAVYPVDWPEELYTFFSAFETASAAGSEVLMPSCILNGSPLSKAFGSNLYVTGLATALVPIVAMFLFLVFWRTRTMAAAWIVRHAGSTRMVRQAAPRNCDGQCRRRLAMWLAVTPKESWQNLRIAIIILLFIVHLMLCRTALDFFVCKPIAPMSDCANGWYLESDPTVQCWGTNHTLWALCLGLPMLLFYGVGIPLGAFMTLHKRKHKLEDQRCLEVYGFMYSSFKPALYYYDTFIYARKAAFAVTGTLLRPYGAQHQCNAGMLILFAALTLQRLVRPYRKDELNAVEGWSLFVSLTTLFWGVMLMPDESGPIFKNILSVGIFGSNLAFIFYVFYQFYHNSEEIKSYSLVRRPLDALVACKMSTSAKLSSCCRCCVRPSSVPRRSGAEGGQGGTGYQPSESKWASDDGRQEGAEEGGRRSTSGSRPGSSRARSEDEERMLSTVGVMLEVGASARFDEDRSHDLESSLSSLASFASRSSMTAGLERSEAGDGSEPPVDFSRPQRPAKLKLKSPPGE